MSDYSPMLDYDALGIVAWKAEYIFFDVLRTFEVVPITRVHILLIYFFVHFSYTACDDIFG